MRRGELIGLMLVVVSEGLIRHSPVRDTLCDEKQLESFYSRIPDSCFHLFVTVSVDLRNVGPVFVSF